MKKLQTIAKFAGVSVDELMKEFDDDDRQKTESSKPVEEGASSLSFLPAPQHNSDKSEATDPKGTEETTEKEAEIKENGIIPLNPLFERCEIDSDECPDRCGAGASPVYHRIAGAKKADREEARAEAGKGARFHARSAWIWRELLTESVRGVHPSLGNDGDGPRGDLCQCHHAGKDWGGG